MPRPPAGLTEAEREEGRKAAEALAEEAGGEASDGEEGGGHRGKSQVRPCEQTNNQTNNQVVCFEQ